VKLIGLTGGIGAGKSTVSNALRDRGAVIVDADAITKELQQPGTEVFAQMVAQLGDGILAADGTLDRQGLADIVFNDKEKLTALQMIVWPAVAAETAARIEAHKDTDTVVVLDIPMLTVKGRYGMAGILVVDTPVETAVSRLVEHRAMPEDDARARIANQPSRDERRALADFVVDNGGTPEDLAPQIDAAMAWIAGLPDWTPEPDVTAAS
jgi:dephospho-CoA kinase